MQEPLVDRRIFVADLRWCYASQCQAGGRRAHKAVVGRSKKSDALEKALYSPRDKTGANIEVEKTIRERRKYMHTSLSKCKGDRCEKQKRVYEQQELFTFHAWKE
jgi:hypothetical protein